MPMFRTTVPNNKAGPFGGNLVVSMRPYKPSDVAAVDAVTSCYPGAHGGPVHWGDPAALGLSREKLAHPDWGDAVTIHDDEIPVLV